MFGQKVFSEGDPTVRPAANSRFLWGGVSRARYSVNQFPMEER